MEIYITISTEFVLTFAGGIAYPNKSLSHFMYISLALTLVWWGIGGRFTPLDKIQTDIFLISGYMVEHLISQNFRISNDIDMKLGALTILNKRYVCKL